MHAPHELADDERPLFRLERVFLASLDGMAQENATTLPERELQFFNVFNYRNKLGSPLQLIWFISTESYTTYT